MARKTVKTEAPTAWHPGGLREIARLELAPEALAACDALLAGLVDLCARDRTEPADELRAVARDLAAVAAWLRTVEEHARRSTLDLREQGMARVAASGARELEALVETLGEQSAPRDERGSRAEASLREIYLLELPDGAWHGGLRWILEELRTAGLEEGRVVYEPTMVTAYCRAAGRELRYLASRPLDLSTETAAAADAAGRTCLALAEQLDAVAAEPVTAGV